MEYIGRPAHWIPLVVVGCWKIGEFIYDTVSRWSWKHNRLVIGNTVEGKLLLEALTEGYSNIPQKVRYCSGNRRYIITGIACLPAGDDMDSPPADIVRGGVGCEEVIVELKNPYNRKWGCKVEIRGRLDTADFQDNPIPEQNKLEEGTQKDPVLYNETVEMYSTEPYQISYPRSAEYHNEVITGITCLPAGDDMDSPLANIVSGGVDCKEVTLELKNPYNRKWGCKVEIRGRPDFQDNRIPEQNKLEVGTQNELVLYSETVDMYSTEPYQISYPRSAENHNAVITGITCLPVDSTMDSPETTIKSGGLYCREVKLELKNNHKRKWKCKILIYGRHSSADVEQNKFIVGSENNKVLHQVEIQKNCSMPHSIFYSCPKPLVITGIACLPADSNMDSPETTIKSGGLGCNEVEVELKNRYNRKWGCKYVVYGGSADF